ncbi:hypothetical protein SETIT_5G385600v2 [Setaria italica]|uniref:Uncharacterized protein n=1 Tax=Setaria italica TaxID=4555 RepID=A0A368RDB6_SETIT|nr:hypothetical protein SETIT_5G385600v2 [Setaria italica]
MDVIVAADAFKNPWTLVRLRSGGRDTCCRALQLSSWYTQQMSKTCDETIQFVSILKTVSFSSFVFSCCATLFTGRSRTNL